MLRLLLSLGDGGNGQTVRCEVDLSTDQTSVVRLFMSRSEGIGGIPQPPILAVIEVEEFRSGIEHPVQPIVEGSIG